MGAAYLLVTSMPMDDRMNASSPMPSIKVSFIDAPATTRMADIASTREKRDWSFMVWVVWWWWGGADSPPLWWNYLRDNACSTACETLTCDMYSWSIAHIAPLRRNLDV